MSATVSSGLVTKLYPLSDSDASSALTWLTGDEMTLVLVKTEFC
jgi:hypothetical protein